MNEQGIEQIIKLLPDNLANQIAAGEVVQRPASVVKELLENAIDCGATDIQLIIKEGGKHLVQVIDNGSGMSALDARMAFERHATSKIRNTQDLFNIRTLGFRGEALASIAAVSQVQLKTRLMNEDLGTSILIEGSQIKENESCMTVSGTSIAVKNLFYNVPARRNFLKSNPVETRHILNEFIRVAIPNPHIQMRLENNDTEIYNLPKETVQERLVKLFGSKLEENLIEISQETPYVNVHGYIGTPEVSKKIRGEQFFFVNSRFIKNNYLNHAIKKAYEDILPSENHPFYCLFLEIDPEHVDINIHPTKTEVKFDDEKNVYALLLSVVRKGIGSNIIRNIEPVVPNTMAELIGKTPAYSPPSQTISEYSGKSSQPQTQSKPSDWDSLYKNSVAQNLKKASKEATNPSKSENPNLPFEPMFPTTVESKGFHIQFQDSYILTPVGDELWVINQQFAHQRILFEKYREAFTRPPSASQQMMFPKSVHYSAEEFSFVMELAPKLRHLGFDMKEYGENTVIFYGLPPETKPNKLEKLLEELIRDLKESEFAEVGEKVIEQISRSLAYTSSVKPNKSLKPEEMQRIVTQLLECELPAFTPDGKPVYYKLDAKSLSNYFQKK